MALLPAQSLQPRSLFCTPYSVGHSLALVPQLSQMATLLLRTHGQHPHLRRGLQARRRTPGW